MAGVITDCAQIIEISGHRRAWSISGISRRSFVYNRPRVNIKKCDGVGHRFTAVRNGVWAEMGGNGRKWAEMGGNGRVAGVSRACQRPAYSSVQHVALVLFCRLCLATRSNNSATPTPDFADVSMKPNEPILRATSSASLRDTNCASGDRVRRSVLRPTSITGTPSAKCSASRCQVVSTEARLVGESTA